MKINEVQIGEKYYFLTVIKQIKNSRFFECLCDCGTTKNVDCNTIGRVKSCGCYNRESAKKRAFSLNKKYYCDIKHPLYNVYKRLKREYKDSLINEWQTYELFYNWAIDKWRKELRLVKSDDNLPLSSNNAIFIPVGDISKKNLSKAIWSSKNEKKRQETVLKKYGRFSLENKDTQQKAKDTLLERYGVNNASVVPGATEKAKETSIKKYGVSHHMMTEESKIKVKKALIESGHAYSYNNKMSDELAEDCGVSRSCMNARIRKYGFETAISMDKSQSAIERIIELLLIKHNIDYTKQHKIDNYIADFFLLEHNVVIEVDGLYWHSDAINKDNYYHQKKKKCYDSKGYKSLFFRENEIEIKLEIVESIILNKIGKCSKLYARKCVIEEKSKVAAKLFFESNHLMGNGKGKTFCLTYDGEIVAAIQMTNKKNYCEISRFCTKRGLSITGGFSKLLKHVIKHFNPPRIMTFIDRRYGEGLYLLDMGFKCVGEHISFCWTKNSQVFHRMKFKSNSGYNEKFFKLWDCGQAKYTLDFLLY